MFYFLRITYFYNRNFYFMQTFQKKYISDYNVTTKCNKLIFIRQFLKSFLRKTLVTTPSMEFLIYVFIICLCGYFAVALS